MSTSSGSRSWTNSRFWRTASAVPRYQSLVRPRPRYGWRRVTPPRLRSRSHGRPTPMWSIRLRGAYCVRIPTSVSPEFTTLLSAKSMIRYLPPNGTPGLARTCDRIERRSASPPARMRVSVEEGTGPILGCAPTDQGDDPGRRRRRLQPRVTALAAAGMAKTGTAPPALGGVRTSPVGADGAVGAGVAQLGLFPGQLPLGGGSVGA